MNRLCRRIEWSLQWRGWRTLVSVIEENPATKGEVVLWIKGAGYPVCSISGALKVVCEYGSQGLIYPESVNISNARARRLS